MSIKYYHALITEFMNLFQSIDQNEIHVETSTTWVQNKMRDIERWLPDNTKGKLEKYEFYL